MRKLAFRAWDKTNKVWVRIEGFLCENKDGVITHVITDDGLEYEIKYFELARLTGPKDKNDKEIFENDLLKGNHSWSEGVYKCEYVGMGFVLTNYYEYQGEMKEGNSNQFAFKSTKEMDDFEVIGNIYENPGLIK